MHLSLTLFLLDLYAVADDWLLSIVTKQQKKLCTYTESEKRPSLHTTVECVYKHFARTNWKVIQLNRVKETRAVVWYDWNFVTYMRTIEKKTASNTLDFVKLPLWICTIEHSKWTHTHTHTHFFLYCFVIKIPGQERSLVGNLYKVIHFCWLNFGQYISVWQKQTMQPMRQHTVSFVSLYEWLLYWWLNLYGHSFFKYCVFSSCN